jgi:hypothetical protein
VLLFLAAALTLATLALGRIDIDLAGARFRVTHTWRPMLLLAVVAAAWWRVRPPGTRSHACARVGFAALLAAWIATCLAFHVQACGGLDSAGYVGASALLASGKLAEDQPIARLLPFPEASQAAAPLGFVVGADGRSRVPRFPLGLPIVMAAFRVLGPDAVFWVSLVMALGTLALAYQLGRSDDEADEVSGLFAASVVAISPTFFNGAIQPMSDVAATFWIVAAVSLSLARSCRPIGAGLAAGMAVLTRPVLLPAALTIAGLLAWRCGHTLLPRLPRGTNAAVPVTSTAVPAGPSRASLVAGMSVLAVLLLAQAALNVHLYGSALSSGYGSPASLLNPARIAGNLATYAFWITRSHTPFFWIAWGAGLVVLAGRRWPAHFSLVAAAAIVPYLFYLTFDDWESTRFVLPALVLALIVGARGTDAALARYARGWRPIVLLAVVLALATASHQFLAHRNVFDLWRGESKYPRVGQWVRERTPQQAVVVSALHSGSIHHYAGRDIVRWDVIPERMLAPSVASLISNGHSVYLALDAPSEAGPFAERFRRDLTRVSMIPLDRIGPVFLYELACRMPIAECRAPE